MSVDVGHQAVEDVPIATVMVRVEHDGRGGWQVALPNRDRIKCRTFDQARREAYVSARRAERCELIVHDAYHRVLSRELVNPDPADQDSGYGGAAGRSLADAAAGRGNYLGALTSLPTVEAIGRQLDSVDESRRARWRLEVETGRVGSSQWFG